MAARSYLDARTGNFIIENYNWAKPFSNFLPGIAGKWGVPAWVYYLNRGQVISSAGVKDKNGQIIEFYSFNKAHMRIFHEGYRTFLREGGTVYEPFCKTRDRAVRQTLAVGAAELTLHERNPAAGWETDVVYYPLPNLPFAGLVRELTVRNSTKRSRRLEWLDGLARILPHGLDLNRTKTSPRHIEGMMGVVPVGPVNLFRLRQTPDDSEQVGLLTGGNFHFAAAPATARTFVDPEAIFGDAVNYDTPWVFTTDGLAGVRRQPQYRFNKTPCAFAGGTVTLPPGGALRVVSVIGYVATDEAARRLPRQLTRTVLARKRVENRQVIDEIGQRCFTVSSDPVFDAYCRYDFLDNVIRGGMPEMFPVKDGKSAFYTYSRQNGDLERDYHFFVVEPTYLSQGTGHYRSVLQNRRTDTWFFPETEDANLKIFLNLVQFDGYNPLEVKGLEYTVADRTPVRRWLARQVPRAADRARLTALLDKPFTPGALVMQLEEAGALKNISRDEALRAILAHCREGELGALHEGFWVDHWHYNLDLIDIYLMVYPDRLRQLLLGGRDYSYFDDPDIILPRDRKSVDAHGKIRRYGAVVRDPEKLARAKARVTDPYRARTRHGKGEVYRTNLLVKLLTITVNRLATLDPAGTGTEMEAGKPGWNDSMNGLPGLFGSALCETLELRKAVRFLQGALAKLDARTTVPVYAELAQFMHQLQPALRARARVRGEAAAFRYWQTANTLKETYREQTRLGISGREETLSIAQLRTFLAAARAVLDAIFAPEGRRRVLSPQGVPYTYFVNDVVKAQKTAGKSHLGYPLVKPLSFRQRPVKLFLEGAVHWMKDRPEEARHIYRAVRRSDIFDRKLQMYKSCENMTGESFELGRAVGAYPRGWIENESIYLHMEYKYLLEILRSGLCDEFWADAKTTLMPFLDPAVYGRSTLEGASFIVSSAYHDKRYHGQAFQPRLSGITCEFLHIWVLAVAGERPFRCDDATGELRLELAPRLPGWLFTTTARTVDYHDPQDGWERITVPKNAFACKFLGRTLVVYHNRARRNTYGKTGVCPVRYVLQYRDGRRVAVDSATVAGQTAHDVRDGLIKRLEVTLAP